MSVEVAQRYFELMDSSDAGTDDVIELYAEDPVVHSSRAGVVRGREEIRQFYEDNAEFFTGGAHHMEAFHQDGNVVVCEGYLDGETAVGRSADGVPLCDVMEFNDDDEIVAFRAYLDYRGYVDEVPEDVPNVRAEATSEDA
ncbi:nuclear transport factor 2 family protein [Halosolutus amylolyticus]|uniref:Nuclear transport factor 2 family protein n=1 Tax=Halosolutus amylolyticus TaxID=2932267 RepID=A0ABD5PQ51_9EURY|nr:nuclear transport factor 2 family protein [Halosolutus amylolyticus]